MDLSTATCTSSYDVNCTNKLSLLIIPEFQNMYAEYFGFLIVSDTMRPTARAVLYGAVVVR